MVNPIQSGVNRTYLGKFNVAYLYDIMLTIRQLRIFCSKSRLCYNFFESINDKPNSINVSLGKNPCPILYLLLILRRCALILKMLVLEWLTFTNVLTFEEFFGS